MNRLHLIFFLIFSLHSAVFAQSFRGGLISGLSTSQIDGDTQGGYDKAGFYGGVFVERDLNKLIGLKSELYYIAKGAKDNVNGIELFKTQLHYIELPVYVKVMPINNLEFDFGLAFSYLIKAKMWKLGEEYPEGIVDVKNTQLSAIASGSYFFSKKMAFNVRFDYGFLPIKNSPNWFSNNLSLGILFLFNS